MKQTLFSLRTTAIIFCLLILLLVLNVVIPQERVVGKEAIEQAASSSIAYRFLLKDLGLSHLPTSVPFLLVVGALYLQLILLLWKLGGSTFRRVHLAPAHWSSWKIVKLKPFSSKDAIKATANAGFRLKHLEENTWWGVRNRYSPIGFLVLHGSFILLLTAGLLLYYTRFVARVTIVVGDTQTFSLDGPAQIIRTPPLSSFPAQPFSVQLADVDVKKEKGEPVLLKARLRFLSGAGNLSQEASVNHPAAFLGYKFLPNSKDLAMTLKLYDLQGYALDSVVVLTNCEAKGTTTLPLVKSCTLSIDCADTNLGILNCNGATTTMRLAEGERLVTESFYLNLVSILPWVSFLVVWERGGNVLIAAFVLAVIGLVMRFIFPRQDIIITSEQLYYKGEFFPLYLGEYLEKLEEENFVTN